MSTEEGDTTTTTEVESAASATVAGEDDSSPIPPSEASSPTASEPTPEATSTATAADAAAPSSSAAASSSPGTKYESRRDGFTLTIPAGWKATAEKEPIVVRLSPVDESGPLKFVSLNVMVGEMNSPEPLSIEALPAVEPHPITGEPIQFEPTKLAGLAARHTVYSIPAADSSTPALRIWQVMAIRKKDTVYQTTYGAPEDHFDDLKPVADAVLKSLNFVKGSFCSFVAAIYLFFVVVLFIILLFLFIC